MIRKTVTSDIDRVMEIYRHGKKIQVESGNPNQWLDGYPTKELILEDIKEGKSYVVVRDNEIIGVFYYTELPDPTYTEIDGKWLNNDIYGTIHRIASIKKGVFKEVSDWTYGICKNTRIDTHEDNKIMQHLVTKNGFEYCGIIKLSDGSPRLAYQRVNK